MNHMRYDIRKLKKVDGIDFENGLRNHINKESYFSDLQSFIDTSKRCLRDYTPAVVIYSDDMQKEFLAEVDRIQRLLISLGMNRLAAASANLLDAVSSRSDKALSDGLLVFQSEMDIMADKVMLTYSDAERETKPVILAVDDSSVLLSAISDMLSDEFSVVPVTSGADALNAIEKHTPELFLLDIEMPNMDGYELMKQIRRDERFSDTPVVFLTGRGSRGEVKAAINIGASGYIVKPVNKELLLSKIWANLT